MKRLLSLAICLAASHASATEWHVEFIDNDGPTWTGIIDSQSDSLTINTFEMSPGPFYTISAVDGLYHPERHAIQPGLVWPASKLETSNGFSRTPYDIPDDWSGDMLADPIFFYGGVLGSTSTYINYGGWGGAWSEDQGIHLRFDTSSVGFGPLDYSYEVQQTIPGGAGVSKPDSLTISLLGQLPIGPGDANSDGLFNSADLVQVFQSGKYQTSLFAEWEDGDWNDDALFDSGDLVEAFQNSTFEIDATLGVVSVVVPEPSSMVLLALSLLGLCRVKPTRGSE